MDDSGNVYVADVFNYRIQKFDGTGAFLTKWGSRGDLPPVIVPLLEFHSA